jgi:hypothetical protein
MLRKPKKELFNNFFLNTMFFYGGKVNDGDIVLWKILLFEVKRCIILKVGYNQEQVIGV